jgi:hypothetical protein
MSSKKLKRVPIKEELVALTGCFVKALILQQFVYWSERTRDVDAFLKEEKEKNPNAEIELTHGWIYKSAKKLHEELMFGNTISQATVSRRLKEVVESGWLQSRHNPKMKWDRKFQYRVDIIKVQIELQNMGYALEGYPLVIEQNAFVTVQNGFATVQNPSSSGAKALVENTEENEEIEKGATPIEPPKPKPTNGANLEPVDDIFKRAFQSEGGKLPTDGMTPEEIAVQEVREGQWRIKDKLREPDIILALGHFLVAVRVKTKRPDFSPPGDGSVRSRWITAVSGHLSDNTPDELKQLYLDAVEIADEKGYFNDSPTSITNDALPRARRKATKPVGGWAALNDDVKRRYDGYGKQHGVTGEEFYNAQKEAAQKAQQEMSE